MHLDKKKHWWEEEEDVHEKIFSVIEQLDDSQGSQGGANLHHLRLYSNRVAESLTSKGYHQQTDGERLRINVIRNVIDAATSHIATNRPRPQYITLGGNYTQRRRAENLSRFINGQFYAVDQYALSLRIFRDACIFGTGIEKIYEKDDKIVCERVFPNEIIVDQTESMLSEPRSMFQHKEIAREVALKVWSKHKNDIEDATLARTDDYSDDGVADMCSCVEAWHLPTNGKGGRHVIAFSNVTVLDEPWERDSFPFSIFKWQEAIIGFFGSGICEELSSIQKEISYLATKIQDHFTLSSGQLWAKKGSGISKGSISNAPWSVNTFRDSPPTLLTPQPINPMFLTYMKELRAQAFQQIGLSEMHATSVKPAGLNSGESLRVYNDIGSKRFQHVGQEWERFHLRVAEQMNAVAHEIAGKGKKSLKVLAAGDRGIEEIDFKDASLDKNKYQMRCYPTSYLPETPSGKIAALREMAQISPEIQNFAIHLLDIPDLDNIRSLLNAPIDIVDKNIELILEKGKFIPPEPMMNLDLARQRATLALLRAESEDTPPDRVELLRRWIVQIDELQEMAQPMMPQVPPGASPEEGDPGMPEPLLGSMTVPPPTQELENFNG